MFSFESRNGCLWPHRWLNVAYGPISFLDSYKLIADPSQSWLSASRRPIRSSLSGRTCGSTLHVLWALSQVSIWSFAHSMACWDPVYVKPENSTACKAPESHPVACINRLARCLKAYLTRCNRACVNALQLLTSQISNHKVKLRPVYLSLLYDQDFDARCGPRRRCIGIVRNMQSLPCFYIMLCQNIGDELTMNTIFCRLKNIEGVTNIDPTFSTDGIVAESA